MCFLLSFPPDFEGAIFLRDNFNIIAGLAQWRGLAQTLKQLLKLSRLVRGSLLPFVYNLHFKYHINYIISFILLLTNSSRCHTAVLNSTDETQTHKSRDTRVKEESKQLFWYENHHHVVFSEYQTPVEYWPQLKDD